MLAHHRNNNNNITLQIIHQLHLGNTTTPLAEEPWTTSIPRLHPTLPTRGVHHHRPHKAPLRTHTSMGGRKYPHLLQPPIPHMGPNNMLNILLAPLKNSNITHHGMFIECRNTTKSILQNLKTPFYFYSIRKLKRNRHEIIFLQCFFEGRPRQGNTVLPNGLDWLSCLAI